MRNSSTRRSNWGAFPSFSSGAVLCTFPLADWFHGFGPLKPLEMLLEPLIALGPLLLAKFVSLVLLRNEGKGDLSAVAL